MSTAAEGQEMWLLLKRYKINLIVLGLPRDTLSEAAEIYSFDDWLLDTRTQMLTSPDNIAVPLRSAEYRLLHVLLIHPNRALSRDQLLELPQERESNPFDRSTDRTLAQAFTG